MDELGPFTLRKWILTFALHKNLLKNNYFIISHNYHFLVIVNKSDFWQKNKSDYYIEENKKKNKREYIKFFFKKTKSGVIICE